MISNAGNLRVRRASWTALRRFVDEPLAPPRAPAAQPRFESQVSSRPALERCELCSAELGPDHEHLVEPATRKLLCTCTPCALLFSLRADTKYRRVPRQVRFLPDFRLEDAQWESLLIPIGLAFFLHSSASGKVMAIYPSPGGPTESLLGLGCWAEITRENPVVEQMEPDTQALLVNRLGQSREHYLAPIDECYRLVGLLRAHWQGLSGGSEVWTHIERFFVELKQRSQS
jgi:hypothetical protein